MESGDLLAREFFNPDQRHVVRLPTPALPGCSPMQTDRRSIRSVFWYSETDVLPAHLSHLLPRAALRDLVTHGGPLLLASARGEDGMPILESKPLPQWHEERVSPREGEVPVYGQEDDLSRESGGVPVHEEEEIQSQDSFETATSQGYRTEEDEAQDFSLSVMHLGWLTEELKSKDWVKVMDQPPVRVMKIILDDEKGFKKGKNFVSEDNGKGEPVKTYCVTDLEMSKQQELVEASFQLRCRIFDFSASSFAAIPLEMVPLGVIEPGGGRLLGRVEGSNPS